MSNTRALAKQLNENAVGLIEQVLQKHTAAILDVVREQTHELEAEREKVRAVRQALGDLLDGLEKTNWSSWQTTEHFSKQEEVARLILAATTEDPKP